MATDQRNIYALLVGISQFKNMNIHPLPGCIEDVEKVSAYLKTLSNANTKVDIKELIDWRASRKAIIESFLEQGQKAGPNDVFLFYFSSHGLEEKADPSLFPDEPDGNLQCLVTHDTLFFGTHPIADKELRYLINKVSQPNKPEIVCLFDCCHSGDNTRAGVDEFTNVKNLSGINTKGSVIVDTRKKKDFIFADLIPEGGFDQGKSMNDLLPQGAHTAISASASFEPALMENDVSLFTHAFLTAMDNARGDISYFDLHDKIKESTGKKQSPQLYTTYDGGKGVFRSFLTGLNSNRPTTGNVSFDKAKNSWKFDLGAIHGFSNSGEKGHTVLVSTGDEAVEARVIKADAGSAELKFPEDTLIRKSGKYKGVTTGLLSYPVSVSFTGESRGQTVGKKYFEENRGKLAKSAIFDKNVENAVEVVIHASAGRYQLKLKGEESERASAKDGYNDSRMDEMMKMCKKIGTWNYLSKLQNPSPGQFTSDKLKILVEQNGQTIQEKEGVWELKFSEPASGVMPKVNSNYRFKNDLQFPIHCSLFYLSDQFGIVPLKPQFKIPAGKQGTKEALNFELDQGDIARNLKGMKVSLKVVCSTHPFNAEIFEQEDLDARERTGSSRDADSLPDLWYAKSINFYAPNPKHQSVAG